MPTYAIGDIHGNLSALDDLLAKVTPEMTPQDTLVFLGDYIDRGPNSRGCVERIVRLKEEATFPVVTLLGNHEQWMLRTMNDPTKHSWLFGMEALETIRSYSDAAAETLTDQMAALGIRLFTEKKALPYETFFEAMPESHIGFFRGLRSYYRAPDVICVHGGMSFDGVLDPLDENVHVWGPLGFPEDYAGHEPVVYGHHDNCIVDANGLVHPCAGANRTFGIDSSSHGVLIAMRFPDRTVWQSSVATNRQP